MPDDGTEPQNDSRQYFAPTCRRWCHREVVHHKRFAAVVGRECQCPCHGTFGRWWPDA